MSAAETEPWTSRYRVEADKPSENGAIIVLTCEICGQHGDRGDIRWYEDGISPSLSDLLSDAEQHERKEQHQ
jgi:hypothetical protein